MLENEGYNRKILKRDASLIMIILIPLNQREWQRMSVSSLKAIP